MATMKKALAGMSMPLMIGLLLIGCSSASGGPPDVFRETNAAVAYDVDNDGFADLGIYRLPDGNLNNRTGFLQVFYGGPDGFTQERSTQFPVDVPWGGAHWIGDVNGDGFADTGIGATGVLGRPPRMEIIFGSGDRTLTRSRRLECDGGAAPNEDSGALMGRAGDLNGDGVDDVVIASTGGRLCAWNGGQRLNSDPDFLWQVLSGTRRRYELAPRWRSIGDLDQDGFDDIVMADGELENPNLSILRGGTDLLSESTLFVPAFPRFGVSDVTGDGLVDLDVSLPGRFPQVFVIYEGVGTDFEASVPDRYSIDLEFDSELNGMHAPLGDVNGDGIGDVALATPRERGGSSNPFGRDHPGSVALLFGGATGLRNGGPREERVVPAEEFAVPTRASVRWSFGLGDIDGDGYGDVGIERYGEGVGWMLGTSGRILEGDDVDGFVEVRNASVTIAHTGAGAL